MRTPKMAYTPVKIRACSAPVTAAPASRPTRIEVRATGETSSRSKNPVWMSVAVSAPAVRPPKSTDWVTDATSRKSRRLLTSGNSGMFTARPMEAVFTAAMNIGKIRPGSQTWGWRRVPTMERRDRMAAWASAWR
jgi:hypothetical protein